MNKLVVVGSSIQPRDGKFTYSKTRSIFDKEERFRQTFFTINSIKNTLPDATIKIVDSSDDYREYMGFFSFFKNVEFIPLKEISYTVFEKVNTHLNKSYCESLLLNTFYKHFKKEIQSHDFVIKATGRYFYDNFNDALFIEENKDKIFFKKPLQFKWNDAWNYWMIDERTIQEDDMLRQYCTVLYGFGSSQLDKMIDINEASMSFIDSEEMYQYDIETLSYYLTRPFKDQLIETDWLVSGWDGASGKFMYY